MKICPECVNGNCGACFDSTCDCDCNDFYPTIPADYLPADEGIEDEDDRTLRESGYC